MSNEAFRYQLKQRIYYTVWLLIFGFLVFMAIKLGLGGFAGGGPGGVIMFFGGAIFAGGAALIGHRLWGEVLAENFTYSLLASRKTLKEAPLILSPYAGMVARGEGLAALADLEELFAQYPDTPEIAGMLAEVYLRDAEAPDQFIQLVENYFARPKRVAGPDNLTLLMVYADLRGSDALPVLAGEADRSVYMPSEQKAIRNRIETLTEQS